MALSWVEAAPTASRQFVLAAIEASDRPAHVVVAGAGLGKTWALAALRARAEPERPVFSVRCMPFARAVPFEPISSLLRLLQASGRIGSPWLEAPAGDDLGRMQAVCDALAAATTAGAFTIQADDLHYCDPSSLQTFEYCIERLQDYPILWIFAARPGFEPVAEFEGNLGAHGLLARHPLSPLSASEMRDFALALDPALTTSEIERLAERSGGNPFFVEALIRSHFDEMSPELRIALRTAVKALGDDARKIATALAAARVPLDMRGIVRAGALAPSRVQTALFELLTHGVIVASAESTYTMRHDLLCDAVVESADPADLAYAHRIMVDLTADPWQRAGHLEAGDRGDRAAELYLDLLFEAMERFEPDEALRAADAVMRLTPEESDRHTVARAARTIVERAFDKMHDGVHLLPRAELNRLLGSLPLSLRVRCEAAYYMHPLDALDARERTELVAFTDRCREQAIAGLAPFYNVIARFHYAAAEFEAAKLAIENGLKCLPDTASPRTETLLHLNYGHVLVRSGAFSAGIELMERTILRAAEAGSPDLVGYGCCMLMYDLEAAGHYDEMIYWGEYALNFPGPKRRHWDAVVLVNLAGTEIFAGRPESALARLASASIRFEHFAPAQHATVAVPRACALLYTDRYEEARRVLDEALANPTRDFVRLQILRLRGLYLELQGEYDRAAAVLAAVGEARRDGANAVMAQAEALAAYARIAFVRRSDPPDPAYLEPFRGFHPIVANALAVASAYAALTQHPSPANARRLLEACTGVADPFLRALDRLEAAKVLRSTKICSEIAAVFASIGSKTMAERACAAAGEALRIGRAASSLTPRELEIALRIAAGLTNREIAAELGLSAKTVSTHVSSILGKCQLRSRVEVALLAARGELPLYC